MLDMETFSTQPNAVVTTIGIVKFDPWGNEILESDGLYLRVNVDEQIAMGRHICENTIKWWSRQANDVKLDATTDDDRVSVLELIDQLKKIYTGCNEIWSQGPTFDMGILDNLYRQVGLTIPWKYWNVRDSRTLFSVHGDTRKKGRIGAHNALSDCIVQAKGVQSIYAKCGIEDKQAAKHTEQI